MQKSTDKIEKKIWKNFNYKNLLFLAGFRKIFKVLRQIFLGGIKHKIKRFEP